MAHLHSIYISLCDNAETIEIMESEGKLSAAMLLRLYEVQSDADSTTQVNVHLNNGFMKPS